MTVWDVLIVGAGPTGLACAIELQKRGLSAVIVEKGCIVNSIYNYPTNMVFFTTPELLEIGDLPMTSMYEKPVRAEALKYYRRVSDHYQLKIEQYVRVEGFDGDDGAFRVRAKDSRGCPRSYLCRKIILATGYYDLPNLLGVPGEDLPKVIHYYKDAHPYYNHDVAVIGGKNSAAIAALELFWTGARVTLVHRRPALSANIKYWIRPNIENRIKNGEIRAFFESHVAEITPDGICVQTPEGRLWLKNDFVFAMTGYHPDFEFLQEHGIQIPESTGQPVTNPDTLESERRGIYLAGVVVAGVHTSEIFIENGRFHGRKIADAIADSIHRRNPAAPQSAAVLSA